MSTRRWRDRQRTSSAVPSIASVVRLASVLIFLKSADQFSNPIERRCAHRSNRRCTSRYKSRVPVIIMIVAVVASINMDDRTAIEWSASTKPSPDGPKHQAMLSPVYAQQTGGADRVSTSTETLNGWLDELLRRLVKHNFVEGSQGSSSAQ